MILRATILAGGVAGAAALSQLPEYSAQYTQRLGGAVDALSQVAADFDASAAAEGLSRQAALEQMTGSAFVIRRRADMETSFARLDRLRGDLRAWEAASPLGRVALLPRLTDPDLSAAALRAFTPAVPLTLPGLGLAGLGFVLGGVLVSAFLRLARLPFRARPAPAPGPRA